MLDNIKILKLVSGEEVLGVVKHHGDGLTVKNPMNIAVVPEGIALVPYPPSPWVEEKDEITLEKNHVMLIMKPTSQLANQYNSKFGSGIVVPDVNIIN